MECGAHTRDGRRCRQRALQGKRRCRLHGGLSRGHPLSGEILRLYRQPKGWLASGSSTHGEGLVKKLDMVAGALPVVTDGRPPDRWTLGELLADTARLGLLSVRQVVLHLLDRQEVQPWETRRLADAGMAVVRLLANVQRDAMRQQADDARWTTTYTQRLAEFEREL